MIREKRKDRKERKVIIKETNEEKVRKKGKKHRTIRKERERGSNISREQTHKHTCITCNMCVRRKEQKKAFAWMSRAYCHSTC